jgi:hypothetical protein
MTVFATACSAATNYFVDTFGEPVTFQAHGYRRELQAIVDLRPDRTVYPLDEQGMVVWDTLTVATPDVTGWLTEEYQADIRGELWSIAAIDILPDTRETRIRLQEIR